MRRSVKVTVSVLLSAFGLAFSVNPIHESSYNLVPDGPFPTPTTLAIGAMVRSQNTDAWEMPLSLALQASPRVEFGAGLKTQLGNIEPHFPYMVFGAKWLALGRTSFQADLLVGTDFRSGKGFSLASHHKFYYADHFYGRLAARLGFMDALVRDDALMAMETAFYPTLLIGSSLELEVGLIGSSQTSGFERYLAMDIQPALRVHMGRHATLETAVAIGLAGNNKEQMRIKAVLLRGF